MMKLQTADIRLYWSRIKQQAIDIAGDDEPVEELYAACRYGRASLYVSDDCWVVLRPYVDPYKGVKKCLVWAMYCDGGDAVERYVPQLIEIAKSGNAVSLTMESQRRGWERRLAGTWKTKTTTYELEI